MCARTSLGSSTHGVACSKPLRPGACGTSCIVCCNSANFVLHFGCHALLQTADETTGKHMSTWEYSITVTPRSRPPPLGSPLPHLHRDWARYICSGSGTARGSTRSPSHLHALPRPIGTHCTPSAVAPRVSQSAARRPPAAAPQHQYPEYPHRPGSRPVIAVSACSGAVRVALMRWGVPLPLREIGAAPLARAQLSVALGPSPLIGEAWPAMRASLRTCTHVPACGSSGRSRAT